GDERQLAGDRVVLAGGDFAGGLVPDDRDPAAVGQAAGDRGVERHVDAGTPPGDRAGVDVQPRHQRAPPAGPALGRVQVVPSVALRYAASMSTCTSSASAMFGAAGTLARTASTNAPSGSVRTSRSAICSANCPVSNVRLRTPGPVTDRRRSGPLRSSWK